NPRAFCKCSLVATALSRHATPETQITRPSADRAASLQDYGTLYTSTSPIPIVPFLPARMAVNCPGGSIVKMPDSLVSGRARPWAVNSAADTGSSIQLSLEVKMDPLLL